MRSHHPIPGFWQVYLDSILVWMITTFTQVAPAHKISFRNKTHHSVHIAESWTQEQQSHERRAEINVSAQISLFIKIPRVIIFANGYNCSLTQLLRPAPNKDHFYPRLQPFTRAGILMNKEICGLREFVSISALRRGSAASQDVRDYRSM
jgi:hypothetical protein